MESAQAGGAVGFVARMLMSAMRLKRVGTIKPGEAISAEKVQQVMDGMDIAHEALQATGHRIPGYQPMGQPALEATTASQ